MCAGIPVILTRKRGHRGHAHDAVSKVSKVIHPVSQNRVRSPNQFSSLRDATMGFLVLGLFECISSPIRGNETNI